MPYCSSRCSPFAEEKNREKIKGSENATDSVQGREKKEDGSLPLLTVHDITSCMVPSSYSFPSSVLPPPIALGGNPLFGRLVLDTLVPVEHEKADGRTAACFE